MPLRFAGRPTHRVRPGGLWILEEDRLVLEEPLEIRLNNEAIVVTMRTPGDDEELALGFLYSEGIIRDPHDVMDVKLLDDPIEVPHGNVVDIWVKPGVAGKAPKRLFHTASACGVCGLTRIKDIQFRFEPVRSTLRVPSQIVATLPERMRKAQPTFEETGGLHAAALFDEKGRLLCLKEDVGRHNATDKVVGWAWRKRMLPLDDAILAVSGRAGFEIVQKAVAAGIPIVAAVGAASSLAAELAENSGVALAGFNRENRFNIYAHPERILP